MVRGGEKNGMACFISTVEHHFSTWVVCVCHKRVEPLVCLLNFLVLHAVKKKKNTLKENAIQNLSGSYQMVALRLLIFSLDHRLGQQSESGGIAKALLSLYQRNTREKP